MANTTLRMNSLLRLYNGQLIGVIRCYHPEIGKFPGVPLPFHDSEFDIFPESGQPFNLFVPDLSEVDYYELKNEVMLKVNNAISNGLRNVQKTTEIDLILISNQALQTAKDVPNKIMKSNYFRSGEGTIAVDKIFPLEKLMTSVKDKLSNVTNKLSTPQVIKAWESVKEKLPNWQNTIATKLQEIQNRINKGPAKKGV